MPCSLFLDAGNRIQHNPQNSPSFFADLCICYFWILGIFWKSQNCWRQFNRSFNKCFLHHHDIYAVCVSPTSPREVCQNTGEIPDSAARSLPIPSRVMLSSPVAATNPASWTGSLLGLLPAEPWQKLVAVPQTFLIWGSGAAMSQLGGNGAFIIHPCSQVRSQKTIGLHLVLLGWVSSVKSPGVTSPERPLFFNYWEKRSDRNPSWCCRKQEWGNIGGGNIGDSQKLKAGRQKRIRIFSAENVTLVCLS